jgi:hypothetical protein
MIEDFNWLNDAPKPDDGLKLHVDFKQNQKYARTFIERFKHTLVEGMLLKVGGSTSLPESLLWVKYSPPRGIPEPDYAFCVNLNAPHADVKSSLEWYFNAYHKIGERILQKYSQPKVVPLRQAI